VTEGDTATGLLGWQLSAGLCSEHPVHVRHLILGGRRCRYRIVQLVTGRGRRATARLPPGPQPPPRWRGWLLVPVAVFTFLLLLAPRMHAASVRLLSYSQFLTAVQHAGVKTAEIDPTGHVAGTLAGGAAYSSHIPTAITQGGQLASLLQQHHVQITGLQAGTSFGAVAFLFLPLILFVALFWLLGRRAARGLSGGLMGIGSSRAKVYDSDRPATRFADVAGYDGAKAEVAEVVDFLKNPGRYAAAGAVGPRGVLLAGPPGTGKTLIARAVAGEAEVPFLALSGSSFVELFVGVGASRAQDLFATARKQAPAIIFIDEIDAIGGRRGASVLGNDEREQTLNQLLAEMDGFDPATGVVVIAAINRPETLDPALLRPGRFDREVEIGLPNRIERAAILAVHVRGKRLDPGVGLDLIARGTPGFSGADLANLMNEATIVAVRDHRQVVSAADFEEARDRILLGRREASNALRPQEKHSVAVHEAGHALVAVLSEHADPVAKVTILPAGQALGATEQLPADDRRLYPESYLTDSLAVRLGGRAAERLVLGEASTGAADDLSGATQLAVKMVRDWGLSPRLGPIGYTPAGPGYLGEGEPRGRPYAEGTQRAIDEEVARLLADAEARATRLLESSRAGLDALTTLLVERETISGQDIAEMLMELDTEPAAIGSQTHQEREEPGGASS